MAMRAAAPLALILFLGACQAQPTPSAATRHVLHEDEDGHDHDHGAAVPGVVPTPTAGLGARWTPTEATADSSVSHHVAAVAIDGDLDTFWDNGTPAAESQLTLAFAERHPFRWARLKTGPLPDGVTMKFFVSDDGAIWNPVSGRAINSTWGMELQELTGEGKYLRVRFYKKLQGPDVRFKVYELEAYGGAPN
jgi:hypothetical protein